MAGKQDSDIEIEIVSINDSTPFTEKAHVPNEREIVDAVVKIWKEDPSTETLGISKLHVLLKQKNSSWNVSEKRFKALLRKFGLLWSADLEQYSYTKEVTSHLTPEIRLPDKVILKMTHEKGKGLFAADDIKEGELLWEESPLFLVPPLAHTELISSGKACSYCGRLANDTSRSKAGISVLEGLDCNLCQETWCSLHCKKSNQALHSLLKHPSHGGLASKQRFDSAAFSKLTEFCIKKQWSGLYAIALVHANCLLDKSGTLTAQFNSMARVSQRVRYKALNSSAGAFDSLQGGALFVAEEQEQLWSKGYKIFCDIFPAHEEYSCVLYEEFMFMMGCYNINNLDSSVYLLQSLLNHDCSPNIKVVISPNRYEGLKVYSSRNIRGGEELYTSYVSPSHTLQQRRRELRVNWGFICKCHKCENDLSFQQRRKSSSSRSLNERSELRQFLQNTADEGGRDEFELDIPVDFNGERRKSVRFDDRVLRVT